MRLNEHPVECPGCKSQVNPFVVKSHHYDVEAKLVECPSCSERFEIHRGLGEANQNRWLVHSLSNE